MVVASRSGEVTVEDQELLAEFVVEAKEHLADVENQFLAIEEAGADVDVDLVNEVFRAIHSIKGAAGFLGLTRVNDLAHSLENVLNLMRNGEMTPTSPTVDTMLRAADTLSGMIDDVENSESVDVTTHVDELEAIAAGDAPAEPAAVDDPAEAASQPADEPAVTETPAVAEEPPADAADADADIDAQIAAAFAARETKQPAKPKKKKATPQEAQNSAIAAAAKKPTPADANIRVSVGVLDSLMNLAGELVLSRNQLLQAVSTEEKAGLDAISARLDQITSELQEAIMQTRMQQIGTVFGRFPRVVRDLGAKLGKQCDLTIEGKEVEVDKTIVEAIGDPLTHLVRNSVDHGIESPADRVKAGKPAAGTVQLKAFYQAGKVRIEI
ncbi:MAG: Hpt domain-containing protein, partial [Planctomycetota bacterium]